MAETVNADPSPTDVEALAKTTRAAVTLVLEQAKHKRTWLGLSLGVGNAIVKIGQYAGSGGAIAFGLNAGSAETKTNAGRNAALSGAVAAGVTLLEQVFKLDEKRTRVAACTDLDVWRADLENRTDLWVFNRNSAAYRKTVPKLREDLLAEVRQLYNKCIK